MKNSLNDPGDFAEEARVHAVDVRGTDWRQRGGRTTAVRFAALVRYENGDCELYRDCWLMWTGWRWRVQFAPQVITLPGGLRVCVSVYIPSAVYRSVLNAGRRSLLIGEPSREARIR